MEEPKPRPSECLDHPQAIKCAHMDGRSVAIFVADHPTAGLIVSLELRNMPKNLAARIPAQNMHEALAIFDDSVSMLLR